jgi:hypothetical protein
MGSRTIQPKRLIWVCMTNLPEIVNDVLVPVDVSEAFVALDRIGIRFQLGHKTMLEAIHTRVSISNCKTGWP